MNAKSSTDNLRNVMAINFGGRAEPVPTQQYSNETRYGKLAG
jgi:hypothetical protein